MKTINDITLSVDELAGRWTEPTLRLLHGVGMHPISVDLELETWRTLEKVLRAERGLGRFQLSKAGSLNRLKERAIRKAAELVARRVGFPVGFTLSVTSDSCVNFSSLVTHRLSLQTL